MGKEFFMKNLRKRALVLFVVQVIISFLGECCLKASEIGLNKDLSVSVGEDISESERKTLMTFLDELQGYFDRPEEERRVQEFIKAVSAFNGLLKIAGKDIPIFKAGELVFEQETIAALEKIDL
jgi:hypothetical protein